MQQTWTNKIEMILCSSGPCAATLGHPVCSPSVPQSPARPPASPAPWTASLTSLWCRGTALQGRSSTPPSWRRKTASRAAAGLTASSAASPTSSAARTTRWRSSPPTGSVTPTPVRTRCSQVRRSDLTLCEEFYSFIWWGLNKVHRLFNLAKGPNE